MMESDIKKSYNELIFDEYKQGSINQHSVGMYYVKMDLAINDKSFEAENIVWNEYIGSIGNKQQAIDQGYFWAVKEAKLIEISAVLEGSNVLTPTIDAKNNIEPVETTHANEPEQSTQNKSDVPKRSSVIYF